MVEIFEMIKGMCFDLDGTLSDTLPVVYGAFQEVTSRFLGRAYTEEEISKLFGPNEVGILKKLFGDRWTEIVPVFHEAYENAHGVCENPYDGIEETLRLLRERNIQLAVITGRNKRHTEP